MRIGVSCGKAVALLREQMLLLGMIGLMLSFVLNKHCRAWVKGRCEIIALYCVVCCCDSMGRSAVSDIQTIHYPPPIGKVLGGLVVEKRREGDIVSCFI